MNNIRLKCDKCGAFYEVQETYIFCDGCYKENKGLIEEIQGDLDSLSPDIPFSYEPLGKLREKWEEKKNEP